MGAMVRRAAVIPQAILMVVLIALCSRGSHPSVGADGTPGASPVASTTTSIVVSPVLDCAAVTAYLTATARITLAHEMTLVHLADSHVAYLPALDRYAQVFTAVVSGGITRAGTQIEVTSAAIDDWEAAEVAARAICAASWVTVAGPEGTPPARVPSG